MTGRVGRCPSPRHLERGYGEADAELGAHAASCDRCGAAWRDMARIEQLGAAWRREPVDRARLEQLRTRVLAGAAQAATRPPKRRPAVLRVALAGLVPVAALAWWIVMRDAAPAPRLPPSVHRAVVHPHSGARYVLLGGQPNEIVKLVDGTIDVEVAPLHPGERFRVVTADAEVEVRGTAFRVFASAGHLRQVDVDHGVVDVRLSERDTVTLTAGQAWNAAVAATENAPADAGPPPAPPGHHRARTIVAAPARAVRASRSAFDDAWRALRAGRFDDAADGFARAGDLARGDALEQDADYWRAVALGRGGQHKRAIRAMRGFVRLYPASPRAADVHAMLGWLLLERGDTADAETAFRAAVAGGSERARQSARQGLETLRSRHPRR